MAFNDDDDDENETGRALTNVSATQLAAIKKLGQAAANVVASHPSHSSEPLLNMLKGNGVWAYGLDGTQVEAGSEWAANPFGCEHGVVAWNPDQAAKQRKLGERMAPITQGAPDPTTLPDVGGQWDAQYSLLLRCMSGEDKGLQVRYKTTSSGGKDACIGLIDQIGRRANAGEIAIVPVLQLGFTTYKHPSYGVIYKPQFKVIRWISIDDAEDGGGGGGGGKPPKAAAKEPETRRRRAAA